MVVQWKSFKEHSDISKYFFCLGFRWKNPWQQEGHVWCSGNRFLRTPQPPLSRHDLRYDSHHLKGGRLRSCCPHQLGSARGSGGLWCEQKTEESHWFSAPPLSTSVLGETGGMSL